MDDYESGEEFYGYGSETELVDEGDKEYDRDFYKDLGFNISSIEESLDDDEIKYREEIETNFNVRQGANIAEDISANLELGGTAGGKYLEIEKKRRLYATPVDMLKDKLNEAFTETKLLNESDKNKLLNTADKLFFAQHKNALACILGWYISKVMPFEFDENNDALNTIKVAIATVQKYIGNSKIITIYKVIKYARFWKIQEQMLVGY